MNDAELTMQALRDDDCATFDRALKSKCGAERSEYIFIAELMAVCVRHGMTIESATQAGLIIVKRPLEQHCGDWLHDIRSAEIIP